MRYTLTDGSGHYLSGIFNGVKNMPVITGNKQFAYVYDSPAIADSVLSGLRSAGYESIAKKLHIEPLN